MNLWLDEKNHAKHDWLRRWCWCTSVGMAFYEINHRQGTKDPITLISVSAAKADEFLEELDKQGGTYEVTIHDGEPSARATQLINKNHWDRKVMDSRTTDIIMVLKGQHNLRENLPEDFEEIGPYYTDLALYLSDDCMCPYETYKKDPGLLFSSIREAVMDYMKACDNPSSLLFEYFESRRMFSDKIDDMQSWCSALMMCAVKNGDKYINGFNEENTRRYRRQRQFYRSLYEQLPQSVIPD